MLSLLLKGEYDRDTRRFVFVFVCVGGGARIEGREGKSRGAGGGEGGKGPHSYRIVIQFNYCSFVRYLLLDSCVLRFLGSWTPRRGGEGRRSGGHLVGWGE